MNNRVGLKDMFEHKEALTLLARSIMPNLPHVMQEATKLMAAVCIVPPGNNYKETILIKRENIDSSNDGLPNVILPTMVCLMPFHLLVSLPNVCLPTMSVRLISMGLLLT